jgi:hypothetical protein
MAAALRFRRQDRSAATGWVATGVCVLTERDLIVHRGACPLDGLGRYAVAGLPFSSPVSDDGFGSAVGF